MNSEDEENLVSAIARSFRTRKLPTGRIIRPEFNLGNDSEADRVDRFIRNAVTIDRSNLAQCAFTYLIDEAILAILPIYLKSIIMDYNPSDYLNYVVSEALSPALSESAAQTRFNIGSDLFEIANNAEAEAICSFVEWYYKKAIEGNSINEEIYGPSIIRAIELWGSRKGCGAIFADSYAMGSGNSLGSGSEHRTPDFGRSCPGGSKSAQRELTLSDAMHEFDAGDRDRRMSESLEPEHRPQTKLDRSVILFNQIIQIFRRSNSSPCAASMLCEKLARRPM